MSTYTRDTSIPLIPGVVPDRQLPTTVQWIGTEEAGRILGVSGNAIQCRIHRGTCPIPYRRGFGGRGQSFTFRLTDVLAWRDRRAA